MWSRTLLVTFGAVSLGLLATQAWAADIFGAKFTHQLTPPEFCTTNKGKMCSWVLLEAQGNAGNETAPRDGIISKIRLVACAPGGSFVLQVVHVRPGTRRAKVIRTGPLINYLGTKHNCTASRNFDIEEFSVHVRVRAGDSLGVVATQVRFLYNPGSGPSILFDPPLADGDGLRHTGLASGFLMLQAELAP